MNWYRLHKFASNISIVTDQWAKSMRDYLERLEAYGLTPEQAEQEIQRLLSETQANMQSIAGNIAEAINRISDWNGSQIVIKAREYDSSANEIHAAEDAEIDVGAQSSWGGNASFTYWIS